MKELSIEEKAQAYDEALKWMENVYPTLSHEQQMEAEVFFPMFKESEDEKIKNEIINFIKDNTLTYTNRGSEIQMKWIAWLEKQGNTNETIKRNEFAQGVLKGAAINLITWIDYNAAEGNMCLSNMECKDIEDALVSGDWDKIYAYIKKKLEKQSEQKSVDDLTQQEAMDIAVAKCFEQGEQKPADKVEPKFHEGDWVVSPNGVYWHIDKISNNRYEVTSNTGESSDWNLDTNIYHKFNIQDAKDGDVLVDENNNIGIYKEIEGICWHSYIYLGCNNRLYGFSSGGSHMQNNTKPATKEQYDLLFQKLKEVGYKWMLVRKIENE